MDSRKSLRVGDKVRLKKLDDIWINSHEASLVVKHVGDYSALGVAYGALCVWISSKGHAHEKVYALDEVIPI